TTVLAWGRRPSLARPGCPRGHRQRRDVADACAVARPAAGRRARCAAACLGEVPRMSHASGHGVQQEADHLPRRTVIVIGLSVVASILLSVVIAWLFLPTGTEERAERDGGVVSLPRAPRELGGVEQTLVLHDRAGLFFERQQRQHLG